DALPILVRFARAVDGLPEQPAGEAGLVQWSARGEIGTGLVRGQPLLHLHVRANPVLVCQRCNAPFVYEIDSRTVLQFVKSESELDEDLSDRKSTRLNSSHAKISYAVFCLKKKQSQASRLGAASGAPHLCHRV